MQDATNSLSHHGDATRGRPAPCHAAGDALKQWCRSGRSKSGRQRENGLAETLNELIRKFAPTDHLAAALVRSQRYAREQAQRTILLEHLLLALTEDHDAALVLQASRIDIPLLQSDIGDYLGRLDRPDADWDPDLEAAPHADLVRIFRVAHAAAQQRNRRASGGLVLAAIVGDGRSPAANMLRTQGLTFEEAVRALQQANARPPAPNEASIEAEDAPRAMPQAPAQDRSEFEPPPQAPSQSQFPSPSPSPSPSQSPSRAAGGDATRNATPGREAGPPLPDRQAVAKGDRLEPDWRLDPGPSPAAASASADLNDGRALQVGDRIGSAPPRMPAPPQVYARGPGPGNASDNVDGEHDTGPEDDMPVEARGAWASDADAAWPTSRTAARSAAQSGAQSGGESAAQGDTPPFAQAPPAFAPAMDRRPSDDHLSQDDRQFSDDRLSQDDVDRAHDRAPEPAEDPVRSKLESMHDILAEARRKVEATRPPRRSDGAPVRSGGFRPSREQSVRHDRAPAPNVPPAPDLPTAEALARLDRARAALQAMEPPQRTVARGPRSDREPPPRPIASPDALHAPAPPPPSNPPLAHMGDPARSSAPPPVPSGPPPVRPIGDLNMRGGDPRHLDAPRPLDREAVSAPGAGHHGRDALSDAEARPQPEPARTLARHSGGARARSSGNPPALRAPTELSVSAAHARAAKLSNAVPRRLTAGRPEMVEVRVPRHNLDALTSLPHVGERRDEARHEHAVAKAITLQLVCDEDGVHVEPVGDPLAWIENRIGAMSDDVVCWRWLITPHASGAAELKLSAMARTVMADGSAVETVIPTETIPVRVGRNPGHVFGRLAIGAFLLALGAAAILFADPIAALVEQLARSLNGG